MTRLIDLLFQYKSEHKALPAFNIDSWEIFQAVVAAVTETKLPCLVQLSANEDQFIGAENLYILVKKANLDGLPIYLNMDHGHDLTRLSKLAKLGFDMVHFDGSSLPYEENLASATTLKSSIATTVVEVEFNKIGSDKYTDPQEAVEFMTKTNADLLAVSIGNTHGVDLNNPETIDLELLKNIITALPDKLFTLHGGSGIPLDQIKAAINLGIVKININTDLRLQFRKSLESTLLTNQSEKIYDYLSPAVSAVAEVIKQKLINFST